MDDATGLPPPLNPETPYRDALLRTEGFTTTPTALEPLTISDERLLVRSIVAAPVLIAAGREGVRLREEGTESVFVPCDPEAFPEVILRDSDQRLPSFRDMVVELESRFPGVKYDSTGRLNFPCTKKGLIAKEVFESSVRPLHVSFPRGSALYDKLPSKDELESQLRPLQELYLFYMEIIYSEETKDILVRGHKAGQAAVLSVISSYGKIADASCTIGGGGSGGLPPPPQRRCKAVGCMEDHSIHRCRNCHKEDSDHRYADCPALPRYAEITLDEKFPESPQAVEAKKRNIQSELARILEVPEDRISVEDIFEGSIHVVFKILPPSATEKTPTELLQDLSRILFASGVYSDPKTPTLNTINQNFGMTTSGYNVYAHLVAEAKQWVRNYWSIGGTVNLRQLRFFTNDAINKRCPCVNRFEKGYNSLVGSLLKHDTKLTLAHHKAPPYNLRDSSYATNQFVFGYHGTGDERALSAIVHDGFDSSRRRGQAFGPGEYFSPQGSESYSYTSYTGSTQKLIVAAILGGRFSHDRDGTPHFVVGNPTGGSQLSLASYCLPLVIVCWGSSDPTFVCNCTPPPPLPPPPPPIPAVLEDVQAIFIQPGTNGTDRFYRIKIDQKTQTATLVFEVISSEGPTGTIPFSSASATTTHGSFPTYTGALDKLKEKFEEKTRVSFDAFKTRTFATGNWSCCPLTPTTAAAVPGSYTTVMWQYDHEKNGSRWHNYQFAPDGSNSNFIMEDIYQQIRSFSSLGTTSVLRKVKSGREWEYEVNFNSMSQKNLGHSAHQVRNIRRLENGSRCQCSECTANSAFANIIRK